MSNGRPQKAYKKAIAAYQHISAMITALSLLAFIGHFIQLDWRGILGEVFSIWNTVVRPTVHLILVIFIVSPLSWLGIHIEIPGVVRDYVAVGISTLLSGGRAEWQYIRPVLFFSSHHSPGYRFRVFRIALIRIRELAADAAASAYSTLIHLLLVVFTGLSFCAYLFTSGLTLLPWFELERYMPEDEEDEQQQGAAPEEEGYDEEGMDGEKDEHSSGLSGLVGTTRKIIASDVQMLALLLRHEAYLLWDSVFGLVILTLGPLFPPVLILAAILGIVLTWPFVLIGQILAPTPLGDRMFLVAYRHVQRRTSEEIEAYRMNLRGSRSAKWATSEKALIPIGYLLLALVINYLIPA
jgi:hypothetical protein